MPAAFPRYSLCLLFLVAFWAAVYLPGLGGEELRGEEPRRILPGLEMIRSGDWMQPRIGGEDYDRKPPLINWLTAAGMIATGRMDEFSARLPGTIVVLLFGLGMFAGATRAWGRETGFFAAFFALACIGMMGKGRLAEIEGIYVALTGLAWAAWLGWVAGPAPRPWRGWAVAGVFLGLAFLAKGPVHLLMFYVVVIAWHKAHGTPRALAHPSHFVGLVVAVAVAAPWFVLAAMRDQAEAAAGLAAAGDGAGEVWIRQLTSRLDPRSLDFVDWVGQIFKGVLNFAPWVLFVLPLAVPKIRRAWLPPEGSDQRRMIVALFWGVVIGYLSVALTPAARARFSLPMLVPAAWLAAVVWTQCTVPAKAAMEAGWRRALDGSIFLLLIAALVAASAFPDARGPGMWIAVAAAGVVAIGLLLVRARPRHGGFSLVLATAGVMAAVTLLFAGVVHPLKRGREDLRPVATGIREAMQPGEGIIVYRANFQPWIFYLWLETREIRQWRDMPGRIDRLLVIQDQRWEQEQERITARYGTPSAIHPVPNPWDGENRDLLIIRFP